MFLHAEYQECPSVDGPPTREWIITDMADRSQLGTEERVKEKEALLTTAGIYANYEGVNLLKNSRLHPIGVYINDDPLPN